MSVNLNRRRPQPALCWLRWTRLASCWAAGKSNVGSSARPAPRAPQPKGHAALLLSERKRQFQAFTRELRGYQPSANASALAMMALAPGCAAS